MNKQTNETDAIDYENVCVYDLADLVRLFLKNLPEKLFNKKFTKLAINAFKSRWWCRGVTLTVVVVVGVVL